MKHVGASIIFHNKNHAVILVLRDDLPSIPYPDMWDIPGGHVENHETPYECIVREMLEEIEINVAGCLLFKVYEFSDRTEHVFTKAVEWDVESIVLHEGQMLRWFTQTETEETELAYGFNEVISDFFKSKEPRGEIM
jgi:8-oxo-dGTP diphosphatase